MNTFHFIIDASAFTKGLGNIKRWIENPAYDKAKVFIPYYTIRELDFLKKGQSVTSTNARESIRFIEKIVSDENMNVSSMIILETQGEAGPNWKKCIKYKIRAPKINEFPFSKKTLSAPSSSEVKYESQENDLENVDSNKFTLNEDVDKSSSQRAQLPPRLKLLLRPSIKKHHLDDEEWKLVTEDPATKIWCEAFGIECINIIQAESLLLKGSDKGTKADKLPLDTKHSKNLIKQKEIKGVQIEKYDSISYAPRGSGELWVP